MKESNGLKRKRDMWIDEEEENEERELVDATQDNFHLFSVFSLVFCWVSKDYNSDKLHTERIG